MGENIVCIHNSFVKQEKAARILSMIKNILIYRKYKSTLTEKPIGFSYCEVIFTKL